MSVMPPTPPAARTSAVNRKEFGFGKSPSGQDAVILFGHEVPVTIAAATVGGLGALLLFLRAKSTASNVISAGTTSTPAAAPPTASSTAYDPNAQAIADLQTAVTQIGSEVSALASTPSPAVAAPSTIPTNLNNEVQIGSGYGYASGGGLGNVTTASGTTYDWISQGSQVPALGANVFEQTAPGVFTPFTGSSPNAPGTPLYTVPSAAVA